MSDLMTEWMKRSAILAEESTEDYPYWKFLEEQIESLQRDNEAQRRLRDEQSEYTIALQRLIEHYCGGKIDKFDREQAPHHYDMLSKAAAITPEMREKWHRVANLHPVAGIVYNEPNEVWPEDGEWVLIEIESASGISYETRVHDDRSWPSFGVRWAYIRDLLGEQYA